MVSNFGLYIFSVHVFIRLYFYDIPIVYINYCNKKKIKQNGEMLTKPRRAIRDSSDSNTERARATRSSSGLEGGVHTT